MAIPSSSPSSCRCSFQVRDRLLLLPPASAQIRIRLAPCFLWRPASFHHRRMLSTANSAVPEGGYLPVDVAELLVPAPVLRAFPSLLIQLHRIPRLPQTSCHRFVAHRLALSGQLFRHRFGRFISSTQGAHRISRRRLFQDLPKLYWQHWVGVFHLFPAATRLPDLSLLRHRQFLPTVQ